MSRVFLVLAALSLGVGPVAAQAPPPHLSVLEGRAELSRGAEREPAIANTPLVLGDQLATAEGRAEVLLGDGSALHLDERTTVDFNGDTVVRLVGGRLIVLAERGAAGSLQIDTAPASVRVQSTAEVHVALFEDRGQQTLQVAVVRGLVDVDAGSGPMAVRAGQEVYVRESEAPSYPAPFNSARLDDFARWSQALFDSRRGATSTQYLPADVRVYGSTFDQYGSWSYAAPYGYVWYPRVAVGWRPYHHGRWRHVGHHGWTFVGYDPWGWATHHYGRWGLSVTGSWFWIPSAGWGAAWVHWAVAPGYVGWCPLGWNNRPVIGFWGHGTRAAHYGGGPGHHDPWRAWSVVPTHSFRGGSPVHQQRFDPRPFTGPRAPAFVVQPTPPSVAIPRGSVVAPGSRVAGPSVAPRAGQSRRGASAVPAPASTLRTPPPSAAASSRTSAAPVRTAPPNVTYHRGTPAEPGSVAASPRADAPAVRAPGSTLRTPPASAGASSRTSAAPSRTTPPNVIYHRGTPIEPGSAAPASPGASAYGRAGVAVPRGLPAERGVVPGPAGADARTRYGSPSTATSPYGGSTSPYTGGRPSGPDNPRASRPTPSDHPDYAAPRGGDRSGAPQYRAPEAPRSQGPDRSGGTRGEAPRAAPRSSPPPRADGPSSRSQGAPAGPRSGSSRGASTGTAAPRPR